MLNMLVELDVGKVVLGRIMTPLVSSADAGVMIVFPFESIVQVYVTPWFVTEISPRHVKANMVVANV